METNTSSKALIFKKLFQLAKMEESLKAKENYLTELQQKFKKEVENCMYKYGAADGENGPDESFFAQVEDNERLNDWANTMCELIISMRILSLDISIARLNLEPGLPTRMAYVKLTKKFTGGTWKSEELVDEIHGVGDVNE